jgi:hypothetical protein
MYNEELRELSEKDIKLDISSEMKLLNEALKESEELFTEVKTHYDNVKKGGSGTLQFVEKQTANLISLKQNKLGIIQQMITAKKTDAELKLKIANANKDDKGNDALLGQLTNQMYDLIIKNKGDKSFDELIGAQKKLENAQQTEEDVDAILEARLEEEEKKKDEKQKVEEKSSEEPEFIYVVDLDKNIYCLDSDYNIIEDASIPDVTITITEIDGEYIAKDEHGNDYQVVEFEEE